MWPRLCADGSVPWSKDPGAGPSKGRGILRTGSRVVRFAGGFLSGLLMLPLLGLVGLVGAYVLSLIGHQIYSTPADTNWVVVRGADLSASGATTVDVKWKFKEARMTCRDACDDLVDMETPATRLEIRDARGDCIVCREQGRWPWWIKHQNAWVVSGRPLSVQERDPS